MAAPDMAPEPRLQRLLAGLQTVRPPAALVAGGCALALAAAGGWWLGGSSRAPAPVVAPNSVAALGDVRLELEAGWAPAAPVEGVKAFSPVPGLPGRALLASGPAVDPTLIPDTLRAQLPESLPAPRKATLGGLPAWGYGPLRHRGRVVELTVLPTMGGMLAVACVAPPSAWSGALGCADGVHAIATDDRTLAPAPDLAFRQAAAPALETLDEARVAGRARLDGARRTAAASLAGAHREAATALAPFAAPGASTDAVAALRDAARGYDALAAAPDRRSVTRRQRARFVAARQQVARADAALAAALAELRRD
jgi:hypothetical protein